MSFENKDIRESYEQYFLPTVEWKDYNVMINGRNFFDQPIKNNLGTYITFKKSQLVKAMTK